MCSDRLEIEWSLSKIIERVFKKVNADAYGLGRNSWPEGKNGAGHAAWCVSVHILIPGSLQNACIAFHLHKFDLISLCVIRKKFSQRLFEQHKYSPSVNQCG